MDSVLIFAFVGLMLLLVGGALSIIALPVAGGVCIGFALGVYITLDVARRDHR